MLGPESRVLIALLIAVSAGLIVAARENISGIIEARYGYVVSHETRTRKYSNRTAR